MKNSEFNIFEFLQDDDGDYKTAITLTTVGKEGFPHQALLSKKEIRFLSKNKLIISVWCKSQASKNMTSNGKLLLSFVCDKKFISLKCLSIKKVKTKDESLNIFQIEILETKIDQVDYANIQSGISFSLKINNEIVKHWKAQEDLLMLVMEDFERFSK